MKQARALYCLSVGFDVGARLDKTINYEVVNGGYSFKAQFTPITFVMGADLNQPIHHSSGRTFIFGFHPQDMQRIASLTKKDLDDALQAQQNWINLTKRMMQSGWQKVLAAVISETQALAHTNAEPVVPPPASSAATATPATPPMQLDAEPNPITEPAEAPSDRAQETPVTGSTPRGVLAYNLYVASAKESPSSNCVGYSAIIKDLQSGEVTRFGEGRHSPSFGKMIALALKEAFEAGIMPPSTKANSTLVNVFTSDTHVANMFRSGLLKKFAKGDWKKKDGNTIANKEEWECVWMHASHMIVKGFLAEDDNDEFRECAQAARKFANDYHQQRHGLIPPSES